MAPPRPSFLKQAARMEKAQQGARAAEMVAVAATKLKKKRRRKKRASGLASSGESGSGSESASDGDRGLANSASAPPARFRAAMPPVDELDARRAYSRTAPGRPGTPGSEAPSSHPSSSTPSRGASRPGSRERSEPSSAGASRPNSREARPKSRERALARARAQLGLDGDSDPRQRANGKYGRRAVAAPSPERPSPAKKPREPAQVARRVGLHTGGGEVAYEETYHGGWRAEEYAFPDEGFFRPWSFVPRDVLDLRRWPHADVEDTILRCVKRTEGRTQAIKLGGGGHVGAPDDSSVTALVECRQFVADIVTSVDLSGCTALSDGVCRALAKAAKRLTYLDLSRCGLLTDRTLRAWAQSANARQFRTLKLAELPKITDMGVTELLEKNGGTLRSVSFAECARLSGPSCLAVASHSLEDVDLSGWPRLDDDALSTMIAMCGDPDHKLKASDHRTGGKGQLKSLVLRDSPGLTDGISRALLEVKVISGWKKHGALRHLRRFELTGNPKVSDEIVERIALACPALRVLNLARCRRVGGGEMLAELAALEHLVDLDLTDTAVNDESLETLAKARSRGNQEHLARKLPLRRVDLSHCKISDLGVRLLVKACDKLRVLRFEASARVAEDGLLAVAEHCATLREVALRVLPNATDGAVVQVARCCRKLKRVEVSQCATLGARGIKEIVTLKHLTALDVSGCEHVDDAAVSGLPRSMVALRAARLPRVTDAAIRAVAGRCPKIRAVDLRGCGALTERAVFALLGLPPDFDGAEAPVFPTTGLDADAWAYLRRLDVGGCRHVDASKVAAAVANHPYLACSRGKTANDPEAVVELYLGLRDAYAATNYFVGESLSLHWTAESRDLEVRNQDREDRRNSVHAVNLVKAQWRIMREHRREYEDRFDRLVERDDASVVIQSFARGVSARYHRKKLVQLQKATATIATMLVARVRAARARRRVKASKALARRAARRRYLLEWSRVERTRPWIVGEDPAQAAKANAHFGRVVSRKKLTDWHKYSHRDGGPWTKRQMAFEFWGRRKRAPLLHAWQTAARVAVAHHNLKILALTFLPLKLWALERSLHSKKLVEVKIAVMKIRFDADAPRVFAAFKLYAAFKRNKRRLLERAEPVVEPIRMRSALSRAMRITSYWKQSKINHTLGVRLERLKHLRSGFVHLWRRRVLRRRLRNNMALAEHHFAHRRDRMLEDLCWPKLVQHARKRVAIRAAKARVELLAEANRVRRVLAKFRLNIIARRAGRASYEAYLHALADAAVCIAAVAVAMGRVDVETAHTQVARARLAQENMDRAEDAQAARNLELEEWERTQEERVQFALACVVVQRMWRGKMARDYCHAHRIDVDYSIIILQSAARRWFAKRLVRRMRRHIELRLFIQREMEAEGMEAAEEENKMFAASLAQIKWVQTQARMYLAKRRVHRLRAVRQKEAAIQFVEDHKKGIETAKKKEKERQRALQRSEESALVVQRRYRGVLGRRRFDNILQFHLENLAALKCQTAFRKALARRDANAHRRVNFALHYQHLQRGRQGKLLRGVFGRYQRATQRAFLRVALPLGLDPMSYTLSPLSQASELRTDAIELFQLLKIEAQAWRDGGFDAYQRGKKRSELLTKAAKATELRQGDAVRVVDTNNSRRGQTAFLAAIDDSVPGKAVAELTFDSDGANVSIPMMTIPDAFTASRKALCRIDALDKRYPDIMAADAVIGNKTALIMWARAHKSGSKATQAAVVIQCAARKSQARKRVGRVRYAYWCGSRARRVVLLKTLTTFAAMHIGGARALLRLKLGLNINDLRNDLPAWEAPELSALSVPPIYSNYQRVLRQKKNMEWEVALRHRLRALRIRALRTGARPNNVVRQILGGVGAKISAIATVREDREGDMISWKKFVAAAPVARSYRRHEAARPQATFLAHASDRLRLATTRRLAFAASTKLKQFKAAWYLGGADALLDAANDQYKKQFKKAVGAKTRRGAAHDAHNDRLEPVAKVVETQHIGPYADRTSVKPKEGDRSKLPPDSASAKDDAKNVWAAKIDIGSQFGQSPHLRVKNVAIYHGAWAGNPTHKIPKPGSRKRAEELKAFAPHGEGFLEFLDGYGCAEEEKTLKLTIFRASDIRVADLLSSDPYVRVECNGRTFRTRVKRQTLNPEYNETFEVDVSDPAEVLRISLWDWDRLSADDFLGDVLVQLGALPNEGRRAFRRWFRVGDYRPYHPIWRRSDPLKREQIHDRGEIEVELHWQDKPGPEDLDRKRLRRRASRRLQAWARNRLATFEKLDRRRKKLEADRVVAHASTIIQAGYRVARARRVVRMIKVRRHAAVKLESFFRRRIAWEALQVKRKEYHAARRIQIVAKRRVVATARIARLRIVLWIEQTFAILTIQGMARIVQARERVLEKKAAIREAELAERRTAQTQGVAARSDPAWRARQQAMQHISRNLRAWDLNWLIYYGRDATFGTKRLRRIAMRAAKTMISNAGTRIRTVYGPAIVLEYPAPPLDHEFADGDDDDSVNAIYRKSQVGLRLEIAQENMGFKGGPVRGDQRGTVEIVQAGDGGGDGAAAPEAAGPAPAEPEEPVEVGLRVPSKGFVLVELLGCREPLDVRPSLDAADREEMVEKAPRHEATIRLGSVDAFKSVLDRLVMLQCKFRFLQARWLVERLLRQTIAARTIQAMVREWLVKRVAAKIRLQAAARMFLGKLALRNKRREVEAAKTLQRAYRMMHAKRELDVRRSIQGPNAILVSSEYDIEFNADKTLDHNPKTFWCSRSGATKKQWIVYDLGAPICIGTIELQVREDTTAPRSCVVEACNAAKGHYTTIFAFDLPAPKSLVPMAQVLAKQPMDFHNRKLAAQRRKEAALVRHPAKITVRMDGGRTWWRVTVPTEVYKVRRYWRLRINKNWSSSEGVTLSGIRWLRAKEYTPKVVTQPRSVFIDPGPQLNEMTPRITLTCEGDAWPLPTYQWFKDGAKLEGEVDTEIVLQSRVLKSSRHKKFRCIHCRKVNPEVPANIYRNICMNCKTLFNWPEQQDSAVARGDIVEQYQEWENEQSTLDRRIADLRADVDALDLQIKVQATRDKQRQLEDADFDDDGEVRLDSAKAGDFDDGAMKADDDALAASTKEVEVFDEKQERKDDDAESRAGDRPDTAASERPGTALSRRSSLGSRPGTAVSAASAASSGGARPDLEAKAEESEKKKRMRDSARAKKKRQMQLLAMKPADRLVELRRELKECEDRRAELVFLMEDLAFDRLEIKPDDPVKQNYDCEGIYHCEITNLRGGSVVRRVPTRKCAVVIGDPPPLLTKVTEDYHPRSHQRRKYYAQYVSMQGFMRRGEAVGDVILKYYNGDTYCGPLVGERWLDSMGVSRHEGRDADHWGEWRRPSGLIYEGVTVDNHFDMLRIYGDFRITYPVKLSRAERDAGLEVPPEVYEGQIVDGKRHGVGEYDYADGSHYGGEWFMDQRQGYGRLGAPDGSTYDGEWDRGRIHGYGTWKWADGSSYTGETFEGIRTGKGCYISSKHDVYIGDFKDGQLEGSGVFAYHDGSRFEGHFKRNQRHGLGVFTDVFGVKFIGDYIENQRHGEFVVRRPVKVEDDGMYQQSYEEEEDEYDDMGVKIPKIQKTKAELEYERSIRGTLFDEIQIGLWERGEFWEWLGSPVNPLATLQFCKLFEEREEEYDGVYALMIARRLPKLPHGVQNDHPRVLPIIERIRMEGGSLVARDTYEEAKEDLLKAEPVLELMAADMRAARDMMAEHEELLKRSKQVVEQADMQLEALLKKQRNLSSNIEKFWDDDPHRTRDAFLHASDKIQTLELRDFFVIRYFPEPPPLLEKVLRAACILTSEQETWKAAQLLLSSSQINADEGDQVALTVVYDIKLKYKLLHYDVWDYAKNNLLLSRIAGILVDPRFKASHHHIKSYGSALPMIVDWVRCAYLYIQKCADIAQTKDELTGIEGAIVKAEARKQSAKDEEAEAVVEYGRKKDHLEETERRGRRAARDVERLRSLVLECEEMIEEYHSDEEEPPEDYYLALDGHEGLQESHMVEIMVDELCQKVTRNVEDPPKGTEAWLKANSAILVLMGGRVGGTQSQRDARAAEAESVAEQQRLAKLRAEAQAAAYAASTGLPPPGEFFKIKDFIWHATHWARMNLLKTLPYYHSGGFMYFGAPPEGLTVLVHNEGSGPNAFLDYTAEEWADYGPELCEEALYRAITQITRAIEASPMHHDQGCKEFICLDGARVDPRYVEELVRDEWAKVSRHDSRESAVLSWSSAFPAPLGDEGEALDMLDMEDEAFYVTPEYMAILARSSIIMKKTAIREAAIWERHEDNRGRVVEAEARIAAQFEYDFETTDRGAARTASDVVKQHRENKDKDPEDETRELPGPDALAAAVVWRKLNPGRVLEARLDDLYDLQMDFEENNSAEEAPRAAARLLAGVSIDGLFEAPADQIPFAEAWASGNVEKLAEVMESVGDELAMEFWDQFAEDGDPDDEEVVKKVAVKAVRSQKDPRTPLRFKSAGKAWKGLNRAPYVEAEAEVMLELYAEDEAKTREVSRLETEMSEKESIMQLRARSRVVRQGAAGVKDKDAKKELQKAMDDEATQDSAALTDFKEQNRLKIMDLLTWRKAQHERLRDEARSNYEHEANDRAYLVVLKKVRPTDRRHMLADQAADHVLRVDCHHADYASEEAIVKQVEARIAFYTPKEKQYDADGREIDEFGNLVEVDDPTKVDEATAQAIRDGAAKAGEDGEDMTEAELMLKTGEHKEGIAEGDDDDDDDDAANDALFDDSDY